MDTCANSGTLVRTCPLIRNQQVAGSTPAGGSRESIKRPAVTSANSHPDSTGLLVCPRDPSWLERRPWSRPPAGNAGVPAGVEPHGGSNAAGICEIAVLAHAAPNLMYDLTFMLIQAKAGVLFVCLSGGVLFAQGEKPSSSPAPEVRKPVNYVRRASAGVTLSVLGLSMVPPGGLTTSKTSPAVDTDYSTTGASQRIGGGVTAQAVITNRFAVSASLLLRRIGYEMSTTVYTTTTITATHEDTRARLIDVPVVLRYYFKDRQEPGPRWFVESGGALRKVSRDRTSIDTTDKEGTNTCCQVTPATLSRRSVRGIVAGAGLQLIDPIGVRVVPEVRYTRWTADVFSSLSTRTRRDQVEAIISLTF